MEHSYIIIDESVLTLVPSMLGGYLQYGITAIMPLIIGIIALWVMITVFNMFF